MQLETPKNSTDELHKPLSPRRSSSVVFLRNGPQRQTVFSNWRSRLYR
jgi:hypothetical protein